MSVRHVVWYMPVFLCFIYKFCLPYPKAMKISRITHRDSWEPEIKLAQKMPSHSYLKLRHVKPFLNPIIILKYGEKSILKSLSLFFFKEGVFIFGFW